MAATCEWGKTTQYEIYGDQRRSKLVFHFFFGQFYDKPAIIIIIIKMLRNLLNNFEASPDFSRDSDLNFAKPPPLKKSPASAPVLQIYEAAPQHLKPFRYNFLSQYCTLQYKSKQPQKARRTNPALILDKLLTHTKVKLYIVF